MQRQSFITHFIAKLPRADPHMNAAEAAKNALQCFLEAKEGESTVIFCDYEKMDVGKAFVTGALKAGLQTRLV